MRSHLPRMLVALVGAAVIATAPAIAIASHAPGPSRAAEVKQSDRPLSAEAAVAAMQPGWNLGNTFDAVGPDETAWGNPRVTQELLVKLKAQGFKSIRMPVTWDQHLGDAPDYEIDPEWLARVQEVVGWALDLGFYVMINMHHDSWLWVHQLPTQPEVVLPRYEAVWTQVAEAFRDAPPRLVFESINEPFFSGSSGEAHDFELMHQLNVVFHDIVRSSGGNNEDRLLVLSPLHSSVDTPARADNLLDTITSLDDPRLIATFHFYGFWPFSVNVAGFTRFDDVVQQDLVERFDRAHETWVANGIPVILGEYGLLGFDVHTGTVQQGEKLKFFEFLGHYARQTQITTQLWDNGQHFNRHTHEWRDSALYQQIASSWQMRSGTASTDLIFVERAAGEPPEAVTVELNRNGNAFVGLFHGKRPLNRHRDFSLNGDELTLSPQLLARLTHDGDYGVAEVLSARFSRGVPWEFNVTVYDRPILSDAAGAVDSFAIPTAFRGDVLATMEAKYADGSFAGPHDWTSFKEFGRTFDPDEAAGEIRVTSTFFDDVRDGDPVTLTFHFWSGETIEYTVTRSGTAVTGQSEP